MRSALLALALLCVAAVVAAAAEQAAGPVLGRAAGTDSGSSSAGAAPRRRLGSVRDLGLAGPTDSPAARLLVLHTDAVSEHDARVAAHTLKQAYPDAHVTGVRRAPGGKLVVFGTVADACFLALIRDSDGSVTMLHHVPMQRIADVAVHPRTGVVHACGRVCDGARCRAGFLRASAASRTALRDAVLLNDPNLDACDCIGITAPRDLPDAVAVLMRSCVGRAAGLHLQHRAESDETRVLHSVPVRDNLPLATLAFDALSQTYQTCHTDRQAVLALHGDGSLHETHASCSSSIAWSRSGLSSQHPDRIPAPSRGASLMLHASAVLAGAACVFLGWLRWGNNGRDRQDNAGPYESQQDGGSPTAPAPAPSLAQRLRNAVSGNSGNKNNNNKQNNAAGGSAEDDEGLSIGAQTVMTEFSVDHSEYGRDEHEYGHSLIASPRLARARLDASAGASVQTPLINSDLYPDEDPNYASPPPPTGPPPPYPGPSATSAERAPRSRSGRRAPAAVAGGRRGPQTSASRRATAQGTGSPMRRGTAQASAAGAAATASPTRRGTAPGAAAGSRRRASQSPGRRAGAGASRRTGAGTSQSPGRRVSASRRARAGAARTASPDHQQQRSALVSDATSEQASESEPLPDVPSVPVPIAPAAAAAASDQVGADPVLTSRRVGAGARGRSTRTPSAPVVRGPVFRHASSGRIVAKSTVVKPDSIDDYLPGV